MFNSAFYFRGKKMPTLRFNKKCQRTGKFQAAANVLDNLTGSFKKKMLEKCFKVKDEELEYLQGVADNYASGETLKSEMTKFYQEISRNTVADMAEKEANSIISDEFKDTFKSLPQILRETHEFATLRLMQNYANKIRKRY